MNMTKQGKKTVNGYDLVDDKETRGRNIKVFNKGQYPNFKNIIQRAPSYDIHTIAVSTINSEHFQFKMILFT